MTSRWSGDAVGWVPPKRRQIWRRYRDGVLVQVRLVEDVGSEEWPSYEVTWATGEEPIRSGRCTEAEWFRRYEYLHSGEFGLQPHSNPRFKAAGARPACWQWPAPPGPPPEDVKEQEQYLRAWHRGRCAICGCGGQPLLLDHDHLDEHVRGLLCGACNTAEGYSDLNIMVAYRTRPPADILEVEYPVRNRYAQQLEPSLKKPGYERHLIDPRYRRALLELCGLSSGDRCWGPVARAYFRGRVDTLPRDIRENITFDDSIIPSAEWRRCESLESRPDGRPCAWCTEALDEA